MNILFFMMAGRGTRFGHQMPKQFYDIEGKPLFKYILEDLVNVDKIDKIVVITNPEYYKFTVENMVDSKKIYSILKGGNGRSKDILTCLNDIKEIASKRANILIYDATHPFVDEKGINEVIKNLNENYDAVTLAEFQYDTTYTIDPNTNIVKTLTPRSEQIAGASPEGFKFNVIYDIFKNATEEELDKMTSAGSIALKNNIDMLAVKTDVINLKITYQNDIEIIKRLIKSKGRIN